MPLHVGTMEYSRDVLNSLIHNSIGARMEEGRSAFKMLIGNSARKRPLGRPRHRWEDNIRMDLKEMGIDTRNWVDSAQGGDYWRAFVNATLNLQVP